MSSCRDITKEMLTAPLEIRVQTPALDYAEAKRIADRKAREVAPDPMLLAWFDRKTGKFSPRVE